MARLDFDFVSRTPEMWTSLCAESKDFDVVVFTDVVEPKGLITDSVYFDFIEQVIKDNFSILKVIECIPDKADSFVS